MFINKTFFIIILQKGNKNSVKFWKVTYKILGIIQNELNEYIKIVAYNVAYNSESFQWENVKWATG